MTRNSSRFIAEGRHGVVIDNSAGQGPPLLAGRAARLAQADPDGVDQGETTRRLFFWRVSLTDLRKRKLGVLFTRNRTRSAPTRTALTIRQRAKSPTEPV